MAEDKAGPSMADLERNIAERQAIGDLAGEAEARAEKAFLLVALGQMERAVAELERAGELYTEADRPGDQARMYYGLGLLLARVPAERERAKEIFLTAQALASIVENPELEVKSMYRIADLEREDGRFVEAAASLTNIIARLIELGNPLGLVDAYRSRSTVYMAQTRPNKALEDLDLAVQAAQRVGDPRLLLQVRLERRALQPFTVDDSHRESFADLAEEARKLGDQGIEGGIELQRAAAALRAGDLQTGLMAAEGARKASLATRNPLLYVMSCLLIAEARQGLNDRPGVLAILLTCKVTMESEFGREAGRPIVMVLDSLERQWGKEGLEAALKVYRQRMRERIPES